jgi:hypothetical protein
MWAAFFRRTVVVLFLLGLGLPQECAFAEPPALQEPEVFALLRLARSPEFKYEDRLLAAQKGLEFLRSKAGEQLGLKPGESISESFSKLKNIESDQNQNRIVRDMGLSRVRQELDYVMTRLGVDEAFRECSLGERALDQQLFCGMAKCSESCSLQVSGMPLFVQSQDLGSALRAMRSKNLVFESHSTDAFHPKESAILKANPKKKGDASPVGAVRLLSEVRGEVYQKTITGAVRNKLTLDYQYAKPPLTWDQLVSRAKALAKSDCPQCTPSMLEGVWSDALKGVKKDIEQKRITQKTSESVVSELCKQLTIANYPFEGGAEEKSAYSALPDDGGGVLADNPIYLGMIQKIGEDLEQKRMKILSSLAMSGGDHLLFLTHALTSFDRNRKMTGIKMSCDPTKRGADSELVANAYQEARKKTDDFSKKINATVKSKDLSYAQITKELKAFMKLAPQTVGEAIAVTKGSNAIGKVLCNAIEDINRDDELQSIQDGAVFWGSLVVGAAVTYFSGGALGPYALAGLTAMNVGVGVYSLVQASSAKDLSEEYRAAAIAQGLDPDKAAHLMNVSEQEFKKFREYQFNALVQGVFSATEVYGLVKAAAGAEKSIAQLNAEMEAALKNGKVGGNSWLKQGLSKVALDGGLAAGTSLAHSVYMGDSPSVDPLSVAQGVILGSVIRAIPGKTPVNRVEVGETVREELVGIESKWKQKNPDKAITQEELILEYSKIHPDFKAPGTLDEVVITGRSARSPPEERASLKTSSEDLLKIKLTEKQLSALDRAHHWPLDGSRTKGNYTKADLAEKTRILRTAFTEKQATALLRAGIAGKEATILGEKSPESFMKSDRAALERDPYYTVSHFIKDDPVVRDAQESLLKVSKGEAGAPPPGDVVAKLEKAMSSESQDRGFSNDSYFVYYLSNSGVMENLKGSAAGLEVLKKIANNATLMKKIQQRCVSNQFWVESSRSFSSKSLYRELEAFRDGSIASSHPDLRTWTPLPSTSQNTLNARFLNAPDAIRSAKTQITGEIYHFTSGGPGIKGVLNEGFRMTPEGRGIHGEGVYFTQDSWSHEGRYRNTGLETKLTYEINPQSNVLDLNLLSPADYAALEKASAQVMNGGEKRDGKTGLSAYLRDRYGVSAFVPRGTKMLTVIDEAAFKVAPLGASDYVQKVGEPRLNDQSAQIKQSSEVKFEQAKNYLDNVLDVSIQQWAAKEAFNPSSGQVEAMDKIFSHPWSEEDRTELTRVLSSRFDDDLSRMAKSSLGQKLIESMKNSPDRQAWVKSFKEKGGSSAHQILELLGER